MCLTVPNQESALATVRQKQLESGVALTAALRGRDLGAGKKMGSGGFAEELPGLVA